MPVPAGAFDRADSDGCVTTAKRRRRSERRITVTLALTMGTRDPACLSRVKPARGVRRAPMRHKRSRASAARKASSMYVP